MKITTALLPFAFVVAMPSFASAQTTPVPPPPPIKTPAAIKARKIPKAPPISATRSKRKQSEPSAMASRRTPGQDPSGRTDMSAKAVNFYPVTKALSAADSKKQQSAIRKSKRIGSKSKDHP